MQEDAQTAFNAIDTMKSLMLEKQYQRLWHLNERDLIEAVNKGNILGIELKKNERLSPCEICMQDKFTRAPFPKRSLRETELFELMHSDVNGPMHTETLGGARYYITFIENIIR